MEQLAGITIYTEYIFLSCGVFALSSQWMVGRDLLVKPVVTEGATSVDVYFPGATSTTASSLWFDVDTAVAVTGVGAHRPVDAPVDKIPVYQRGGSIIPRCAIYRCCYCCCCCCCCWSDLLLFRQTFCVVGAGG